MQLRKVCLQTDPGKYFVGNQSLINEVQLLCLFTVTVYCIIVTAGTALYRAIAGGGVGLHTHYLLELRTKEKFLEFSL